MKKRSLLYVLLCLIFIGSNSLKAGSLIISSEEDTQFELIGFGGFGSFVLAQIEMKSGQEEVLALDYHGLALLVYETGRRYPIVLDGQNCAISLERGSGVPIFTDSGGNKFLYHFLGSSMQYHTQLRMLEETSGELGETDDFSSDILMESKRINGSLDSLYATLPNDQFPLASTLLSARLLMESTYSISTIDDLNDRKAVILDFINKNYSSLQHSDMLQELGRQFMMMNEYVGRGKVQLKKDIIQDVANWVEVLDGRIDAAEVVDFFVATYYNRSMVTQASEIVHAFDCVMLSLPEEIMLPKIGDTIPDFDIADNDGILTENLNSWDLPKILAFVSPEKKASLAETVILLRMISADKLFLPVIAIPVESLSDEIISMSNLTTAYLFFARDSKWTDNHFGRPIAMPLFLLLDENNVLVAMSTKSAEIFSEALKLVP
jgi:hypothetical protein